MNFVSEEEERELLEATPTQELKLPHYPVPFRDWNDSDLRYKGDMEDYKQRIHFKMFKLWGMWSSLRTNLDLEELLARPEQDRESDAYVAKNCIVDILNAMAKHLSDTNLIEEMRWLTLTEEEFKEYCDKVDKKKSST